MKMHFGCRQAKTNIRKSEQNKEVWPFIIFLAIQKILQTYKLLREDAYLVPLSFYNFLNSLGPPVEVTSHCRS
jgi:hypothetical protein